MRKLDEDASQHHQPRLLTAYALIVNEKDETDPGLGFVLTVFEGAFAALGAEFDAGGKAAASFVSGMVVNWITATPGTLNSQFASYASRYDSTVLELNRKLDTIRTNLLSSDSAVVETAWKKNFTYNGTATAVSDLASGPLPEINTPQYDTMVEKLALSQEQGYGN